MKKYKNEIETNKMIIEWYKARIRQNKIIDKYYDKQIKELQKENKILAKD